ncbi:hypothetical protein CCS01_00915 [Rhodopila globiformis]|uniref:Uncharacterized protein n=2 Tax=Rhodopila globiformis TaxID=1071 RepID=A0A2S6NNY2_RHOGL|nr:hypothetical protein CCS01_00915 [Rhodopila globiformis]
MQIQRGGTLPEEAGFAKRDAAMRNNMLHCSMRGPNGVRDFFRRLPQAGGRQPERIGIMTYLEAMGDVELRHAEGNRQIALALAESLRALWQAAACRVTLALGHRPPRA